MFLLPVPLKQFVYLTLAIASCQRQQTEEIKSEAEIVEISFSSNTGQLLISAIFFYFWLLFDAVNAAVNGASAYNWISRPISIEEPWFTLRNDEIRNHEGTAKE